MTTPPNSHAPITMTNLFLLAFAGLCLTLALIIAWVLGITLFFPDGVLAGFLVERADVIRAHVDYLMMAQFLFIFFLLFRQYSIAGRREFHADDAGVSHCRCAGRQGGLAKDKTVIGAYLLWLSRRLPNADLRRA